MTGSIVVLVLITDTTVTDFLKSKYILAKKGCPAGGFSGGVVGVGIQNGCENPGAGFGS